ncbi:hypothetical protein ACFVAE_12815 [Microbacterium sp. NPDC057659]|uniref:hypothetical protein n=1 Tax=Microbacterium sp. NPDC057659 TaxID=3346198 RepID=UPI00366D4BE3
MVDVDSSGAAAVQRRRTWMIGGILLLAPVLLDMIAGMPGAWPGVLSGPLFAAALVIFAIGLGRGGSVTARRPLGTGTLIGFAIWNLAWPWVMHLIADPGIVDGVVADDYYATMQMLATSGQVVSLILAIIVVTQIGRVRVVPRPWNWAPLWALVAVVVGQVLQRLLVAADLTALLMMIGPFYSLIAVLPTAFLGVLAIVLSTRRDPASVIVY